MKTKLLKIDDLIVNPDLRVRAHLDVPTYKEYEEGYRAGSVFPPLDVFDFGDDKMVIVDGEHRFMGAILAEVKKHECVVHEGSKQDAIKFALQCNTAHGLRRTNEDKRHAVVLALSEFDKFSDGVLADMCAVSHTFVAIIRKEVQPATVASSVSAKRIGRDGSARKVPSSIPKKITPAKSESKPAAKKEKSTPKPPSTKCKTGIPIPPEIMPLWDLGQKAKDLLALISKIKSEMNEAKDDLLFVEVNFQEVQAALSNLYTETKRAVPYAVCPSCNGLLIDDCTSCKGRGFVSQFWWSTFATAEVKALRKEEDATE